MINKKSIAIMMRLIIDEPANLALAKALKSWYVGISPGVAVPGASDEAVEMAA